jgi:2-polyprenyl-3-methyl-5-hydroxy-6-metoxy-1,4-benzoquinol methylase
MNDPQQTPQTQWSSGNSDTSLVEASEQLPLTWERLIPKQIADDSASRRFFQLHYDRYQTANYVSEKQVLDIACGAGYGSQILSQAGAKSVTGVDVCSQTVDYAQKNYQSPSVTFVCADAEEFTWPESFDVVISFETIEHLHQPAKFLDRLHNLLVPGGYLLLSVPLGETSHFDPYHLHAFSEDEIFSLLENAGFEVESYRCDPMFMNRLELLRWGQIYPYSSPSLRELLFTPRGWRIMRDFVLRGGFNIPQLLVIAHRR